MRVGKQLFVHRADCDIAGVSFQHEVIMGVGHKDNRPIEQVSLEVLEGLAKRLCSFDVLGLCGVSLTCAKTGTRPR